ncbi:siderophore-interacting protein [Xylophilus sp.]|uniref:siderophore-interacting protein n=1 Tax=Xylophilus sp. TaxID=2653893 RepID=UPI0013BB9498|nr:siderophore-interacting protein [Xylophilus sp.]KAF1047282.1 MAG: NADPH-dependent ferric-chelate reductase [Xylophilus sp.]
MTEPVTFAPGDRTPQRVRHELRFRRLSVRSAERITPSLVRVTLQGAELAGFASAGFDDHVKLFFPDPSTGRLVVPNGPPGSPGWSSGPRPIARDYTPRRYDAAAGTLEIDFAIHEAGPATAWALQAAPGQEIGLGGPRGSFVVPTGFDAHLLVADDTGLPAVARRLAELPAGTRAIVIVEVDSEADQIPLPSAATVDLGWVYRLGAPAGEPQRLLAAVQALQWPQGDVYSWVAAEATAARALRAHLVGERGANPRWVKAAGYWRRGEAGAHEKIED